jgi:hypothetical protein
MEAQSVARHYLAKPYPTDEEAEDELARELALYLPLHDPDYGMRIMLKMAFAMRERRRAAGLLAPIPQLLREGEPITDDDDRH